jgi:hypothetical protein
VRVAADERAVGEEVVREVLRPRVATSPLEQLVGERLRAFRVTERDEHLGYADERASLAGSVTELLAECAALLEGLECTGIVARVVDEQPAEEVERRCKLASIAELAPERDRVGELLAAGGGVAVTTRQRPQGR